MRYLKATASWFVMVLGVIGIGFAIISFVDIVPQTSSLLGGYLATDYLHVYLFFVISVAVFGFGIDHFRYSIRAVKFTPTDSEINTKEALIGDLRANKWLQHSP